MKTNYRTFLDLTTRLGTRDSLKIGNNTYAERLGSNVIGIRLHGTHVVTLSPHRIVLNSGGWHTVTTKDRLNTFLPFGWGVVQVRGLWYLRHRVCTNGEGSCLVVNAGFRDGITLEDLGAGRYTLVQDSEVLR